MADAGADYSSLTVIATPLRKQVEDKLRAAIVRGRFPPGAHLSDRALCEMFRVSRTVVREAVRQLEAEGLIETLPHRGSFVKAMSAEEAAQIYDLRGVLEALAAESFAARATPEEIAELKDVFSELCDARDRPEGFDILAIKQRFYEILLRGARNEYVTATLNQILNRNTLLRATSLSDPERLPRTIGELSLLMDAIDRRDPEAAWHASLEHVKSAAAVAISNSQEKGGLRGRLSAEYYYSQK